MDTYLFTCDAFCILSLLCFRRDKTFAANALPAWAGQPHETSFAAPKAKCKSHPKAKAKALASRAAGESEKGARPKSKGSDPELDKIALQRQALMTGRKWQGIVGSVSDQVSEVLDYSKDVAEAEEFLVQSQGFCFFQHTSKDCPYDAHFTRSKPVL